MKTGSISDSVRPKDETRSIISDSIFLRKKTGSISYSIRPKNENKKYFWKCSSQGWNQDVLFAPRMKPEGIIRPKDENRKYYFWQCSS